MKVLLIQPDREFYPGSFDAYGCMERSTLPLGLLCLATAVRRKHEVRILDCLMDDRTRISSHRGVLRHGLAWRHISSHIEDFGPDVIGMTVPFTAQEGAAVTVLDNIKRRFPKVPVVLGGCAISVDYGKYLAAYGNTYAIVGEGELSFPLLLDHLQDPSKTSLADVPGLAYSSGGRIVANPVRPIEDLDDIGFPSYDLIDMERYQNRRSFLVARLSSRERLRMSAVFLRKRLAGEGRKRDATLFTSRGCPYNCIFCSIHSQFGFRWRAHSSAYVRKHVELLTRKYGINFIHFEDDNLTLDRKRFEDVLVGLEGSGVRWDAPNGLRADTLDEALLERMKRAGCVRLYVAIESGTERIRNRVIRKNLDLSRAESVLAACRKLGIRTGAFFIIGFPDETREEMLETLRLASRLKREYGTGPSMFIAQPLPGTDLLKECSDKGCLALGSIDAATYSSAASRTGLIRGRHVGPEEVVRLRESFIYLDKSFREKAFSALKGVLGRL
jgi:anaerobic magnesium-protoporphyrin IX monomethyl ester cyclase